MKKNYENPEVEMKDLMSEMVMIDVEGGGDGGFPMPGMSTETGGEGEIGGPDVDLDLGGDGNNMVDPFGDPIPRA